MNYGQVRDKALQLINQYSIAGSNVRETYNNQADYLAKIPGLVNSAMMEIATTNRKIESSCSLAEMAKTPMGKFNLYYMPSEFFQFKSGGTAVELDGTPLPTDQYHFKGNNAILFPAHIENARIEYYRYPTLLGDSPSDSEELDNTPDTHDAIPFYVAAYLCISDDQFLYATLYNKYEDKLSKMMPGSRAEACHVADVYGGFGLGGGL